MSDIMHAKSLFSYDNFVYAIAGSMASVLSMAMLYPLDTLRSILQIEDKRESRNPFQMILGIIRDDGYQRLYRGLHSVLVTLCVSNFIYFYCYHGLKEIFGCRKLQHGLCDLFTAFLAGCVNVLMTTPLWVVNTRMKFQGSQVKATWCESKNAVHYDGILDGLQQIARREGITVLWNGTVPSLLLVLNPSINFMVYEVQKRQAQFFFNRMALPFVLYFIFGAVAKAVATLATYPLQIVQSRFRFKNTETNFSQNPFVNLFYVLCKILKYQGVVGLYKGLEAKLLQTLLNSAFMFLFYEEIAFFVFYLMGLKKF